MQHIATQAAQTTEIWTIKIMEWEVFFFFFFCTLDYNVCKLITMDVNWQLCKKTKKHKNTTATWSLLEINIKSTFSVAALIYH